MVSAEAPARQCQNSQMKDRAVFETHCRYFAMLLLEVIQDYILSFARLSNLAVIPSLSLFPEER